MKLIALVVRGKQAENHSPELLEQHADVVLSTGEPMGFFGEGGGFSAQYGLFMNGVVADYYTMKAMRPYYVEAEMAAKYNVVSTICVLSVSDDEAKRFDQFWKAPTPDIQQEMQGFSLIGDNCSTAASMAFRHAGILPSGIPGLDTPQNLFQQLKTRYGGAFSCKSGHVGFEKTGNRYKPVVK